jgi:outer membrane protein TolC
MITALIVTLAAAQAVAAGPTLTLDAAFQQAREKNLDLKVAQARLQQAQLVSNKVWANYLPQLSAGASYTRNSAEAKFQLPTVYGVRDMSAFAGSVDGDPHPEYPGEPTPYVAFPYQLSDPITIQPYNQLGAQIVLNQAIIAPALWPAIKAAYLAEDTAELGIENARREILFAVAQLYYGAVGAREALEVQRKILETNLAHEKDAELKYRNGAVPKVALLRAQIDRTRAEADVQRSENLYNSTRSALATLLNRDTNFEVVAPPELPAPPEMSKLTDGAENDRPDVKAARLGVELAEKQVQSNQLSYLPNLGLNARLQTSNIGGFANKNTIWAISLGLNWTLFDGGLREANLRESNAKLAEASAARESTEAKARDELRRAWLDYQSAQANRVKAEEQTKLARENQQIVNVSFNAGTSTYIEVSDANVALMGAELARVAESLNAQLAILRLSKAAGAFDPK